MWVWRGERALPRAPAAPTHPCSLSFQVHSSLSAFLPPSAPQEPQPSAPPPGGADQAP